VLHDEIPLDEALDLDYIARHLEEERRHSASLDFRLVAAPALEDLGVLLDAAYSWDRAGKSAYFTVDTPLHVECKQHAVDLYSRIAEHIHKGGDVWDFASGRKIGWHDRDDPDDWQDGFGDKLLQYAGYASGRAAIGLKRMDKSEEAHKAVNKAIEFFKQSGMPPRGDVKHLIKRHKIEYLTPS